MPGQQPSAADCTKAGLPWFEYYDDELGALNGPKKLAGLDSVVAKGEKLGEKPIVENDAVKPLNDTMRFDGRQDTESLRWLIPEEHPAHEDESRCFASRSRVR